MGDVLSNWPVGVGSRQYFPRVAELEWLNSGWLFAVIATINAAVRSQLRNSSAPKCLSLLTS